MVYTKKGFRIIDGEGLGQFLDLLEICGGKVVSVCVGLEGNQSGLLEDVKGAFERAQEMGLDICLSDWWGCLLMSDSLWL
jgi:hypothetical protein